MGGRVGGRPKGGRHIRIASGICLAIVLTLNRSSRPAPAPTSSVMTLSWPSCDALYKAVDPFYRHTHSTHEIGATLLE